MRFSPSRLQNWQTCQLQGYFRYIQKYPDPSGSAAIYGSAVHSAVEAYYKGEDVETCIAIFKDAMEEEPEYWVRNYTKTRYLKEGEKMLRDHFENDLYATLTPIALEYKFAIKLGDHDLIGIIDAIFYDATKKVLYLVDWKTGRKPTKDELRLNIQLTSYVLASYIEEFWTGRGGDDWANGLPNGLDLYHDLKGAERKVIWHNMKTNEQMVPPQKAMLDFGRLYRLMESIALAHEKEVFIPTISESSCNWCPYHEICPVYVEEFDEVAEAIDETEVTWKN